MKSALLPTDLDGMLTHVEEECSEVIKEICKIRRFGLDNFHPNDRPELTNKIRLLIEIKNLEVTIMRLKHELPKQ